jgi:hypothetical protein
MEIFPAIVSRRFSWRLMIVGACTGLIVGPIVMGLRTYPWVSIPFVLAAIVILHPIMDQDLPNLIGADMLKSARTYIAIALLIGAELLSAPYQKAFLARFYAGY